MDLDPITKRLLEIANSLQGVERVSTPKDMPTAAVGLPGLQLYKDRWMGPGEDAYVISPRERDPEVQLEKTLRQTPAMFLSPKNVEDKQTIAHELEHLLARRQLGRPSGINTMFDKMASSPEVRDQFVRDAAKAYPYLKEKYGLNSMYFSPGMIKDQGGRERNLAYEMMADLASLEAKTGQNITQDPYLKKNLFKDRETREIYNALTGLRQTRLDAKDLRPHTREKETGSNFFTDILEKLKSKDFSKKAGGLIDKSISGGNKLI
jgi:hypothetical protein